MVQYHMVFSAQITPAVASQFVNMLNNLIAQNATGLTIGMTTPGGDVNSGVFMHNAMVSMPYPITTHNIGNVDSIGNVIFLGGGQRYCCPTATFMFHGVGFNGNPNERLEEKNLRQKLDVVLADHNRLSGIFVTRTAKLTLKQGMLLFKEQKTRDGSWAVKSGFVHELRDFSLPAGGQILMLVQ